MNPEEKLNIDILSHLTSEDILKDVVQAQEIISYTIRGIVFHAK